ncbi:DUF817 family protein [Rhodobacterales bacterium HKCCE2091]|nr:DUF817 family protein [Rhodobacterales bacterium HKCCE2091]
MGKVSRVTIGQVNILHQSDTLPQDIGGPFHSFLRFLGKQASAALFAILLLSAIILSRFLWPDDAWLTRYDALVIFAVSTQVILIATRLETLKEAMVILIFHVTGTCMEVFKLAQGSWDYPDQGVLEIGGVPLFTGFMYAAIGSYIARSLRIFDVRIAPYPPYWVTFLLAALIYGNFFAHHWYPDIRLGLFAATVILFWRTRIGFRLDGPRRTIRLPVAALSVAVLVWIAENVGTFTRTWTYPGQGSFDIVSLRMLGSWYLLLYVAFVTVTLVTREAIRRHGDVTRDEAV